MKNKIKINIPFKGTLEPNDNDDPLLYYYHPIFKYLFRHRLVQAVSLLSPSYENILEIGYGSGILLPTLCSIGTNVTAIDLKSDPGKVRVNLNKININPCLMKGDAGNLSFPDNSFDLVVAISIFEHIVEPEPYLAEVHRVLKPGGHLLVGMPRVDSNMKVLFTLIGFNNIEDHHVTNHKKLLQSASGYFTLCKSAKMFPCFPDWAALYFSMLFAKCS